MNNRQKRSRRGFVASTIALVLCLIALSALTSCAQSYDIQKPPYTNAQLLSMKKYISEPVRYVSYSEIRKLCKKRAVGCLLPGMKIVIYEKLDQETRERTYWHEVGHIADIMIAWISYEQSEKHLRW